MSENTSPPLSLLHLRFKLRVPPHEFLANSREAAVGIASVEGLIWKIWVLQSEKFEIGGMYLFANRKTAVAYLNHPVIQAYLPHCRTRRAPEHHSDCSCCIRPNRISRQHFAFSANDHVLPAGRYDVVLRGDGDSFLTLVSRDTGKMATLLVRTSSAYQPIAKGSLRFQLVGHRYRLTEVRLANLNLESELAVQPKPEREIGRNADSASTEIAMK